MNRRRQGSRDTPAPDPAMTVPPHILAAIRQPAFLWGADGRVAAANDLAEGLAGRPLAGCTPAEIVALFRARTPGGEPLSPAKLPASRALAGEEVVNLPMAITAADGRVVRLLVTASPLRDGDALAGALAIWQDVSALEAARAEPIGLRRESEATTGDLRVQGDELRQQGTALAAANEALDRQRRLLDAILGAVPYRVSLWGRDERIVWVNERFAAERGEPREALVGRSWREARGPPRRCRAPRPGGPGGGHGRRDGRPRGRGGRHGQPGVAGLHLHAVRPGRGPRRHRGRQRAEAGRAGPRRGARAPRAADRDRARDDLASTTPPSAGFTSTGPSRRSSATPTRTRPTAACSSGRTPIPRTAPPSRRSCARSSRGGAT